MNAQIDWHALSPEDVLQQVESSESGLSPGEVLQRLRVHGKNRFVCSQTTTIWHLIWRQFHNPIVYLLLAATLFALLLHKWLDALVVCSVIILNSIIGFVQEYHAHHMMRSLAAMAPQSTRVRRQGNTMMVRSSDITIGDIILLEAGDKIPADLRLLFTKHLQCNEAVLTGESVPKVKSATCALISASLAERECMAYSGTYVTAGMGVGVVVAVGAETQFGQIAQAMDEITPTPTPLSKTLQKIALWMTIGISILGILLFFIGVWRGYAPFDAALAAIALAVAAIPEGLPAILTIASALALKRMAQHGAIVRQSAVVEALGHTSVICTDKTGTLTQNEMTVQKLWTPYGDATVTGIGSTYQGEVSYSAESAHQPVLRLLEGCVLCSDASLPSSNAVHPVGDPTELALLIAAKKCNLDPIAIREASERIDFIPFDAQTRSMASLHRTQDGYCVWIKGAPEDVLSRCAPTHKQSTEEKAIVYAQEGMRVLVVACATCTTPPEDLHAVGNLECLGCIAMYDPPRQDVFPALEACRASGIAVKMITGDHPLTAERIGRELGIVQPCPVLTGTDLDQLTEEEWKKVAVQHHLFARTVPAHKLKLVSILQKLGHIVAMTGDGVNDGPALKQADIGIAMGKKGTAVAQEAAGMILTNDHFGSIAAAVWEGRRVYDNLIKACLFTFPTSIGQALVVFLSVLIFPVTQHVFVHPILPIQILWVNLIVAIALSLPLACEVPEPDIQQRAPARNHTPLFSWMVLLRILVVSITMALLTIAMFFWCYHTSLSWGSEEIAIRIGQTGAVTTIVFFQIFYLLSCRSLKGSIWALQWTSNPSLWIGILSVLLLQWAFVYLPPMQLIFQSAPLPLSFWGLSLLIGALILPLISLERACTKKIS